MPILSLKVPISSCAAAKRSNAPVRVTCHVKLRGVGAAVLWHALVSAPVKEARNVSMLTSSKLKLNLMKILTDFPPPPPPLFIECYNRFLF